MPAELATTASATPEDRLLQAEDAVRAWCGWHIAPVRTATFTFTAWDRSVAVLPTLRVVRLTSLVNGHGDVLDPDGYAVTEAGVLTMSTLVGWGYGYGYGYGYEARRITVTYEHGYETPPPTVTAVVQALATRASSNPEGLVRQQVGPFSNTYSQSGANQAAGLALLDAERDLLAPYRLPKRP